LTHEHPDLCSRSETPYLPTNYSPELHPLNGEWYFTDEVATWLANELDGLGRTLLLGAPTVALRMAGPRVLVDSNPHLVARFPLLNQVDLRRSRVQDVELGREFDAAILDPPWYFPEISEWLNTAVGAVRDGGTIVMPLLLDQTRPSAGSDRARIAALFADLGDMHIVPFAVQYGIPLFEFRALQAGGIILGEPWRGADLISVKLRASKIGRIEPEPVRQPARKDEWVTYIFGTQMVKVRNAFGPRAGGLIVPIPGVADFTLDTVSKRDSRVRDVLIWTSRNRVAGSGDVSGLHQAMQRIVTTGDVSNEIDELAHFLEA
jgi:hypothetical protein